MRKVLMVSFFFPPLGGPGAQRSVKLAKYLPRFGWEPVVLTSSSKDYYAFDRSLFDDLPESIQIVRTSILDMLPVYEWLYKFRLDALARYLKDREASFLLPDKRCGWIPHAYWSGLKTITSQKISALFTTSEPYSSHLIGLFLKLRTGIPWIADFRDVWSDSNEIKKTRFRSVLHRYLEKAVLKYADKVVSTSEQTNAILSKKWSDSKDKFVSIPNGYDEEDIAPLRRIPQQTGKCIILYTGITSGRHTAFECFFRAIRKLLDGQRIRREDIEIRCIGIPPSAQCIKDSGLHDIVTTPGYVEHKEVIRHFAEATILLLVVTAIQGGHAIPGKTFEYMATGRPILALVPPDGAAADVVRRSNTGRIIHPNNTEEIAHALEQYYQEWKRLGRVDTYPNRSYIEQFERKRIAERFAKILDSLPASNKPKE